MGVSFDFVGFKTSFSDLLFVTVLLIPPFLSAVSSSKILFSRFIKLSMIKFCF